MPCGVQLFGFNSLLARLLLTKGCLWSHKCSLDLEWKPKHNKTANTSLSGRVNQKKMTQRSLWMWKVELFSEIFLTEKYEDIDDSISNICHIFEYPQIFTRWEYCSHIVNVYGQGDGGIKQTKVNNLSIFVSNLTAFTNDEQIWEDGYVANLLFWCETVEKRAGNRFKYFIVPNLLLSWTRTALGSFCKGL